MRGECEPSLFFEHVPERGERCLNAGIVCNPAIVERDVEVHSHEYTLAGKVQVGDGELVHVRTKHKDTKTQRQKFEFRNSNFEIALCAFVSLCLCVSVFIWRP